MAAKKFRAFGLERKNGKVRVAVNGGWMAWNLVAPQNQETILHLAQVRQYVVQATWKLQETDFHVEWDEQEFDPGVPGGHEWGQDEVPPDGGVPSPDPQFNGNKPPTFQMPGDNSGGDDNTFVSRVDDGATELVPFDEAFVPRATSLGQEVMTQTVEFVRVDIAEAVNAIAEDVKEALGEAEKGILTGAVDAMTKVIDERLKSFVPKQKGNGRGTIVRVDIARPGEIPQEHKGLAHFQMPKLLKYASIGQHIYLPGPPGGGKSHSAAQAAKCLGWDFSSISFGPTTPESRLWGGMDANGNFHDTAFTKSLIHAEENPDSGDIFCGDELDNGHPGILATINSTMANGWVTLPNGRTVTVGKNWVFIGCANTFGTGPTAAFAGRNRLDPATLDRFAYLPWDTDFDLEAALVKAHLAEKDPIVAENWLAVWHQTRENVTDHGLQIFVTMRGAINGARLLAIDETIGDAWMAVLGDKIPEDQRRKVDPL